MNDEVKPAPVDNSHRDANVAARESQKESAAAAKSAEPKSGQDAQPEAKQAAAAEVETEQDDTQNTPEQSADSESGDAPAQQSRNKKPGVHQRIDELTKEKHDERRAKEDERRAREQAERETAYWREQAMRQQPQEQPKPAQAVNTGDPEPTMETCDYDDARLRREWYSWQRRQEKQQEVIQKRTQTFLEKEAAFRVAHPDYDSVAKNPVLPITQQVAEVLLETDDPPAIAYYLGQNPQEAAAIAQMTPHQIGRAIGRIEAKLSAPPAPEIHRQPEPRTVTKAPPPVTTLSGAPTIKKDIDGMSMAEYDAHRRAERKAKGLSP